MKFTKTIWTNECAATILISGEPYYFEFAIIYDNCGVPETCEVKEFCLTKQPLDEDIGSYVKWGGYPHFKQSECIPMSDDGREYKYICTVNNDWGDMGNCNIFLLFKKEEFIGLCIEDIYMEYSCS